MGIINNPLYNVKLMWPRGGGKKEGVLAEGRGQSVGQNLTLGRCLGKMFICE